MLAKTRLRLWGIIARRHPSAFLLAAQLLSGENEDLAAWFLQRYREALQDLKGKLPGEFEPISTPYGLF